MKMAVAEIITGIFFLLIAVVFFTLSMKLPPPMNQSDLGPATFPVMITVVITVLSIMLLYRGVKGKDSLTQPLIKILRKNSVFIVVLLLLAYVVLMPLLGYYISTVVFFPILLWFAGEKNPKKLALISIFFVLFAKAVFDMLLGVPLP